MFPQQFDEAGDVIADRTAHDARRITALQAALRLEQGSLFVESFGDFVEIIQSFFRIEFSRLLPGMANCSLIFITKPI